MQPVSSVRGGLLLALLVTCGADAGDADRIRGEGEALVPPAAAVGDDKADDLEAQLNSANGLTQDIIWRRTQTAADVGSALIGIARRWLGGDVRGAGLPPSHWEPSWRAPRGKETQGPLATARRFTLDLLGFLTLPAESAVTVRAPLSVTQYLANTVFGTSWRQGSAVTSRGTMGLRRNSVSQWRRSTPRAGNR